MKYYIVKYRILFFVFLVSQFVLAQNEATHWYFGAFAGMKFNPDGSVTTLTDGVMPAMEGCSTISSSTGQLLFYSNGLDVYNRNHQIMPNGSGLHGDFSTTQSGIIVPKPGSANLYYIFTLDEQTREYGFQYSVVDMNLDGGLGAVTTQKNIPIYTPSCEKMAVVKHPNNTDFWIVTHGWNDNRYYAHLLTTTGLNPTPVISSVGTVLQGDDQNTIGYLKIAPNGTKIAVCHNDYPTQQNSTVELLDFDTATGIVSNPQILLLDLEPYGIEFSPNSEILYQPSKRYNTIFQYDLNAVDIPNSRRSIYQSNTFNFSALQLGPNGKIYVTRVDETKLAVINDPDVLGVGCNFVLDGVDLLGRRCLNGLPPFPSSFFLPKLELSSKCEDENIQFSINVNQAVVSIQWDFGDGSPLQNSTIGNHTYSSPNTYTITATVNTGSGIRTFRRIVTILPKPSITPVVTLKQCDDNVDGYSVFNLTEANRLLSTNYANETFTYFETAPEAQNNTNPITNPTTYTNAIVSNDVVYVRVANANGCFRVATLNLNVSTTQIPLTFTRSFTVCDDAILGTNTDGISSFDFSSVTSQIQAIFPVGQQLVISYYRNLADALAERNAITDITNYRNIGYPNTQNIYIRVDSTVNNECLGLGQHITLQVERIPIVQSQQYKHCDDDQDGIYGFDTTNVQSTLLNGLTNVSVAYFDANNNPLPSPLPNPFYTTTQTIKAVVANTTTTACNYTTTISFVVDDLPEAFPINTNLTTFCDDEAVPTLQDGKFAFDTTTFHSTLLGSQTGMIVNYYDQNNNPLPSPLPNPFVTATQNVRVEIINPVNTTCKAVYTIPFIVNPVPKIDLAGNEIVCNEQTLTKTLDAGILDGTPPSDYTYVWKRDNVVLLLETNSTLAINQEGTYTVEVSNAFHCSRTRTIIVVASDLATITNIQVSDLSDNNSIVVTVTGAGDYVYSLDNSTFQTSNVFTNVPAGVYTVYVKDLNGCGTIPSGQVSVLGIPSYFTPNGDGYHDYWNIKGINSAGNSNTQIFIFDRLGKLLQQISPTSMGWDGTYQNQNVPATDYWYAVSLPDGRLLKGHFALKR